MFKFSLWLLASRDQSGLQRPEAAFIIFELVYFFLVCYCEVL